MPSDTFVPQVPSLKVGVRNLAVRFVKKASQWALIYLWGYYALSPGWLLAPLILSVLRYETSNLSKRNHQIGIQVPMEERERISNILCTSNS